MTARDRRSAPLRLAPLLLWVLAACNLTPEHDPVWVASEVTAPSRRMLAESTIDAMMRQQFPVGSGYDPAAGSITSAWRNVLHPFGRHGYRERAILRYEEIGPGRFRAHVLRRIGNPASLCTHRPSDVCAIWYSLSTALPFLAQTCKPKVF